MKCVIYARVSSDEQAETGYGLLHQTDRCRQHAEQRGYTLVGPGYANVIGEQAAGVYLEDYTGRTAFRPAINALLDDLDRYGAEVVIVHRTDRLGRRAAVQSILEDEVKSRGATVEYVNATFDSASATGRFLRRIVGSVDELDYDTLIDRLHTHRLEAVKRGSVIVARPPYGYRVIETRRPGDRKIVRNLEIVEEEAAVIRQIFEWYITGDESGRPLSAMAIAARLTAQRVPTRGDTAGGYRRKYRDGVWSDSVVNTLLRRETYVGRWHYRKSISQPKKGSHEMKQVRAEPKDWICVSVPPIISEEVFEAANARRAENIRTSKRHRKYSYLFTSMLVCDRCDHAYIGEYTDKQRYRCSATRAQFFVRCNAPWYTEEELDREIWQWITDVVVNPTQVEATLNERQSAAEQHNAKLRSLLDATDRKIAEQKVERDRVLTLYKKGRMDEERWEVEDNLCANALASYAEERARYQAQLAQVTYSPTQIEDVKAACERIRIGFGAFTHAERRQAYELLELRVRLSVEDGMRIAYAECMLDTRRLSVAPVRQDSGYSAGKGQVEAPQSSSEAAPDTSSTTPPRGSIGHSTTRARAGRA